MTLAVADNGTPMASTAPMMMAETGWLFFQAVAAGIFPSSSLLQIKRGRCKRSEPHR
jgi:hypothetical protein